MYMDVLYAAGAWMRRSGADMDVLMPRAHGCAGAALTWMYCMPRAHGCAGAALSQGWPYAVKHRMYENGAEPGMALIEI